MSLAIQNVGGVNSAYGSVPVTPSNWNSALNTASFTPSTAAYSPLATSTYPSTYPALGSSTLPASFTNSSAYQNQSLANYLATLGVPVLPNTSARTTGYSLPALSAQTAFPVSNTLDGYMYGYGTTKPTTQFQGLSPSTSQYASYPTNQNIYYGNTQVPTNGMNMGNMNMGSMNMGSMTGIPTGGAAANGTGALQTVFNAFSGSEGTPGILSSQELAAGLQAFAPTGVFSLDSFANFGSALGLSRDASTRIYATIAGYNGGQVTINRLAQGALSFADQTTGTWNFNQFSNAIRSIGELAQTPANPVDSSFALISGGKNAITQEQLGNQLTSFARGNYFSPQEFGDFTNLLGIPAQKSTQIYNALLNLTQNQPTVQNLYYLASLQANPQNGTWSIEGYRNFVNMLGSLPNYATGNVQTPPMATTGAVNTPMNNMNMGGMGMNTTTGMPMGSMATNDYHYGLM
jgi:hypothetical protein